MRRKIFHKLLPMLMLACLVTGASAQSGFFVPQAGKIFFVGDSASIFSDVINRGNIGIGSPATVNFMARTWQNDPQARIPDEAANGTSITGMGGWLNFMSDSGRQRVLGGYNAATRTGTSFPNLRVRNKDGIELKDGSAKVRNSVDFKSGSFYLNDQTLVIGNNDPGKITGYDSTHYFVTGNRANTGILMREKLDRHDGIVVFPVGSRDGAYTPAAVRARLRQVNDYYVTVFDSASDGEYSPAAIRDLSVNKIWQVGKSGSAAVNESDIFLEHLVKDEGSYFAANRGYAYISQLNNSAWDQGFPQTTPSAGILTTGLPDPSHGLNQRAFTNLGEGDHYYTKLTGNNKTTRTKLWFNAYRIDSGLVRVYWTTNPEVNIRTFTVERRFSNEPGFYAVGTVQSLAPGGYSIRDLNYNLVDPNRYKGVTFYRLKMTLYDGSVVYSQEVPVGPAFGMYEILLWPNPAVNYFNIGIPSVVPAKSIVIYNVLGQKLREELVNGRTLIQMGGLLPGTYFISIFSTSNHLIVTKKLVVAGG